MDLVTQVLVALLVIVASPLIIFVGLLIARGLDAHATSVPEGEVRYVVAGGKLIRHLANIPGHYVKEFHDETGDETGRLRYKLSTTDKPLNWLQRKWGVFWVSWLYPARKLYSFSLKVTRMKSPAEMGPDSSLRDWVEYDTKSEVRGLRWRFPHPLFVGEVELGKDRTKVDFVLVVIYEVIDPYTPIFIYNGDFFRPTDAAITNAVMDFGARGDLSYAELVKEKKAPGTGASQTNKTLADAVKNTPNMDKYGLEIVDVRIHDFSLSPKFKDIDEAARAEEVARLRALAKIKEAEGDKIAQALRAEGEAEKFRQPMRVVVGEYNADPNVAISALASIRRAESVGGETSDITTWVEGGVTPAIQIPIKGSGKEKS